ncbi:MAG TPA: sigma-54 dependent transcriptional regulator [Candidatus Saccharimonadales bacterium]|jgi:two-component system response regulator AtoC|nr:sigma-54 dependent transcriptional regulator [Candidatus Saccharimonadales bacterium]
MNRKIRVLIVDDDIVATKCVAAHLSRRGFEVSQSIGSQQTLAALRNFSPALILLDPNMIGADGHQTLARIKRDLSAVPVLILSANTTPEAIFRASKMGADDYLSKPVELRELDLRIDRALEAPRPDAETAPLREQVRRQTDFSMLFGTSPKMLDVKLTIEKVADTTATVLIRGESGTGKEVVARMIHTSSGRSDKPFVKVNCAAIPHELLESELFGYEPGAFTGATRQKAGKFEQSNEGTIFLDEVSEMHPALQAKLLHVLQDHEFSRLGGKRDVQVDVRVLAATNKPLERAVEEGLFREDLFYRLNVVTIHIPPLRERREEVPVFLSFFLNRYSEHYGKNPAMFSDYAMTRMMKYIWPGNIRELENLVKRYVIVGNEAQIIRELSTHKPIVSSFSPSPAVAAEQDPVRPAQPLSLVSAGMDMEAEMPSLLEIGRRAAMRAEREVIEKVMAQTRWNRRQAAKILKISYKALLNKLKAMEEQRSTAAKNVPA